MQNAEDPLEAQGHQHVDGRQRDEDLERPEAAAVDEEPSPGEIGHPDLGHHAGGEKQENELAVE